LTNWKKQKDGLWKLYLDMNISLEIESGGGFNNEKRIWVVPVSY